MAPSDIDLVSHAEPAAPRYAPVVEQPVVASDSAEAAEPAMPAPAYAPTLDRRSPRRRGAYAAAGLATAALVVAAVAFRTHAAPASDADSTMTDAEQRAAATTADAGFVVASGGADSLGSTSTLQLLARRAKGETSAAESDVSAAPNMPAAPKRLATVSVPVIATNVDSLLRASTKTGRESYTDQFASAGALKTSPIGDDAATGTPPVLIGNAPMPYFPDALRSQRTEGEAVVRFRVDERGRVDVSSMKVVRSDHELFTLAVRNVLPRFRFEPARSPAPESKPRAEWVDFRAEFTAKN
jgi:TonB family protein